MSTPYDQGARTVGPRAGDGRVPPGRAVPGPGGGRPAPDGRPAGAGSPGGPLAGSGAAGGSTAPDQDAGGWTPDRGAAARRRAATTRSDADGASGTTGRRAADRGAGRPPGPRGASGGTSGTSGMGGTGGADRSGPAETGRSAAGGPATGRTGAGRAAGVSDRTGSGRGAPERGAPDRGVPDRGLSDRGSAGREVSGRGGSDRGAASRGVSDRGAASRGVSDRGGSGRPGAGPVEPGRTGSDRLPATRGDSARIDAARGEATRGDSTRGATRGDSAGGGFPRGDARGDARGELARGDSGRGAPGQREPGRGEPRPGGPEGRGRAAAPDADPAATRTQRRAGGRPPRPVAGRAAADRAAARSAAGVGAAEATGRDGRLTGATTRLRAYRPGGGRGAGPEEPAGRTNALYDTVDQAALRRVDVRERTADATVYHKVAPGDGLDSFGDGDRTGLLDRTGGASRSAGTRLDALEGGRPGAGRTGAGRRPGGPTRPSDRERGRRPGAGETSAAHATGGRAGGRGRVRPNAGKRGPRWWRNRPRWLRRLVLIGMTSGAFLFVAGIAVIYAATRVPLPDEVKTDQTSIISWAGADGKPGGELARIGDVNRTDVPLSQVSKDVQHAVLAAENENFYNEPGISPRGIARALWVNLSGGEIAQGGSTITQQYAKNAYLTQERTFTRKMREIVLAIKLDQKYSKDQILEFYLNTIYFGRQSYGIEAAAKTYFGKPAAELTAGEGAVIGGLIRSPNYLDPLEHPGPAEARWKDVVATMVAKGWAPASLATEKPPTVLPWNQNTNNSSDQVQYIKLQVKKELNAAGITEDQINRGGLRITTTLDLNRQTAAFQAVTSQISQAYAAVPDLRTGLVAIKPGTGEVLAWYGGSLYGKGTNGQEQYLDNVSGAAVPPGSTFKTITLVAALENNISLRSTYEAPSQITLEGGYVVNNDESEPGHLGWPDLVEATAESINTVYVPLGNEIGVNKIIQTARDMGVDADLDDVAGVTLGQDSVTALDMVEVYGTLASGGYRATPHIVAKVEDNSGRIIMDGATINGKPVVDKEPTVPPSVARDATFALESVIDHGTGKSARLANNRPAAGKTGTTDDFRSAWFCGYTPEISSCVNMFRGKGEVADQLRGIPGAERGVYGGAFPAQIWKAFMDAALQGIAPKPFDPPAYGGIVTQRSPAPAPTPSDLPTQPPVAGTDDWDIFGDDQNDNGQNGGGQAGQTGQTGQTGQQPRPRQTRPPTGGGGGIVVNPFNN
ncbi:glycosyl transferase [Parafrankia soli]|uniref:Glycosyl transferase n=1 Tax=Parafrankia soli TaxID=2599596 RepID=A0A1S1PX42_9ACTN|nr:transglycosylase domain-containing protein [Parafrankia soli]OHV27253.1 glycosyl transferase [Parafrankia soli]